MKKMFLLFLSLTLCLALCLPLTAYASSFEVDETDLSIEIDDTYWYVFTRDNLRNNTELDDLGLTYDYMRDLMEENEAYINAILFYSDSDKTLELFVRKRSVDGIENLSDYSDSEVLKLAEKLADKQGASDYSVYGEEYKFTRLEYYQSGYYIVEFTTVVNGDDYAFTFQTEEPFVSSEYSEINSIIDSIKFDVKTSNRGTTDNDSSLLEKFISGVVIAAIVAGTPILYKFGKKKKAEAIQSGKVYYGVLGCRVLGLFILGVISAEMILMLILGDSVEGTKALLLMLLAAIPFTVLYVFLYKKSFEKKLRTQSIPVYAPAETEPIAKSGDKTGNYDRIKAFFGTEDLGEYRKQTEQQIKLSTEQYKLTRKTDLMKIVFGDISQRFETSQGIDTDMMVSSYYQIALDVIADKNGDMNDFIFTYTVSKMSGEVNGDIHRYLQMLVNIQLLIDEAIELSCCRPKRKAEYARELKIRVFDELNSYIDDSTDWNKISMN